MGILNSRETIPLDGIPILHSKPKNSQVQSIQTALGLFGLYNGPFFVEPEGSSSLETSLLRGRHHKWKILNFVPAELL